MLSILLVVLFAILISSSSVNTAGPVDQSIVNYIFTSTSLPDDGRYMTSIGNGHIATDIFSDTVFMNGLYNGLKGGSHRARIPAYCNVRLNSTFLNDVPHNYSLNTRDGVFTIDTASKDYSIQQRIYAHKFYTRALINEIKIENFGENIINVPIVQLPGEKSDDITFSSEEMLNISNTVIIKSCGKTNSIENMKYQPLPSNVCLYWTSVPKSLEVLAKSTKIFTFIMTIDYTAEIAIKEFQDVLQVNSQPEELFLKHKLEWYTTINKGHVEIIGNDKLAKVVNGVFYYLYSSLPSIKTNQAQNKFYGLSPGGLSRGTFLKDYQGHSFWDTETWMYPPILYFHPDLAEKLLDYRINNIPAAEDISKQFGNRGIRFPWESAYTGTEVTPDCCPEIVEFEQHINGDISFAAGQFLATNNNTAWLKNKGCKLIQKIAEFWESRANYNNETKLYDITEVMGPDEDHPNVTNSVYTNAVAKLSLELGINTSCVCENTNQTQISSWKEISLKLKIPYDEKLDYHPQYDNYERGTIIKQADVVLLGFPLMYLMERSTRINDLKYYESVTRENGPAMTWSIHSINHLELGDVNEANILFNRSYQPYVREPFKIWTEAIEPEIGAVNFITGMGGFLQALVFGYGGIRIYPDRFEINNSRLPTNTNSFLIKDINYMGSSFDIQVLESESAVINVTFYNSEIPLVYNLANTEMPITLDLLFTIGKNEKCIIMKKYPETPCEVKI